MPDSIVDPTADSLNRILAELGKWAENPVGIAWATGALTMKDAHVVWAFLLNHGIDCEIRRGAHRCICGCGKLTPSMPKVYVEASSLNFEQIKSVVRSLTT